MQYYELLGNRAIYKDGWKAVVDHTFSDTYADDVWELYHVADDYSEKNNVADKYPEKLRELQDEFLIEAGRNNVFPMMPGSPNGSRKKWLKVFGKKVVRPEKRYTYLNVFRPYEISANSGIFDGVSYYFSADIGGDGTEEGVLLSDGDRFGGFVFYIKDRRLHFGYNASIKKYFDIASDIEIPEGKLNVKYLFDRSGYDDATVTLYINDKEAGKGNIDKFYYLTGGSTTIGANLITPVVPEYKTPFEFTGNIDKAVIYSYDTEIDRSEYIEKLLTDE